MLLSAQHINWKSKTIKTLLEINCILCSSKCYLGVTSVLSDRCKMGLWFQNMTILQQLVLLQLLCKWYNFSKPYLSILSLNGKVLIKFYQYKIFKLFPDRSNWKELNSPHHFLLSPLCAEQTARSDSPSQLLFLMAWFFWVVVLGPGSWTRWSLWLPSNLIYPMILWLYYSLHAQELSGSFPR